jgi:hypothetical protein
MMKHIQSNTMITKKLKKKNGQEEIKIKKQLEGLD